MVGFPAPDELAVHDPHAAGQEGERRVGLAVGLEPVDHLLQLRGEVARGISASTSIGSSCEAGRATSSARARRNARKRGKLAQLMLNPPANVVAAVGQEGLPVAREEILDDPGGCCGWTATAIAHRR